MKSTLLTFIILFSYNLTFGQEYKFEFGYGGYKSMNSSQFKELFKDSVQIKTNLFIISHENKRIYQCGIGFPELRIVKKTENKFELYERYLFLLDGKFSSENKSDTTIEHFYKRDVLKYNLVINENDVSIKRDTTFFKNSREIKYETKELIKDFNELKVKYPKPNGDYQFKMVVQLMNRLTLSSIQGCNECEEMVNNFEKSFELYGALNEDLDKCKSIITKLQGKGVY